MKGNKLKVVEIFQSVQGEGANSGMWAIFIRLAGCNKNCDFCDTDFSDGEYRTISEIKEIIRCFNCKNIIWTGGEPTLQLTDEILSEFSDYYNCIETNGTNKVPERIDYIACSPKVSTEIVRSNFTHIHEIRYAVSEGDIIPEVDDLPICDNYFLSPIFEGEEKIKADMSEKNVEYCLDQIRKNNRWRLSIQLHKILGIQ